ncbi:cation-independent mannose-6-phosphate receptor isoform X2 [Rhinatrema bivittatum]|uniref:cation-independent mannose-6-phosphate receptor isoform X2 n=1 Tax=Rhinatrema bivittatum TaxID=194408 RepID=UPI00112BDFEB|nr:cation-independent mannose-6-phosphate receptor isoform X2 [Rhinatrema bivittatum]
MHPAPAAAVPVLVLGLLLLLEAAAQSPSFPELCGYTWDAIDTDKHVHYKINLCDKVPSTECGGLEASAICAHDLSTDTYTSVGDASLKSSNVKLILFNTTQSCNEEDTPHKVQSSINLLCAKTLGTPEFVTATECVHYFEWRTSVACKKDAFKATKEVPCYVFDQDLKKHDLNPLIKWSGSYPVDDSDDSSALFINICRNIGGKESGTSACPQGSAACVVKQGQSFDVGQPKEGLKAMDKDRLVLRYERQYNDAERPSFCNGHDPTVSITFVCPSERTEGTDPKLTAKTNCRYEIEWVTEYACHREYLESGTCTLTSEQHDVSVDLTPLSQMQGEPSYSTSDERKEYYYYLNVCGDLHIRGCEGEKVSSCQVKQTESKAKVTGRSKNQILRYSDGDLTLTLPGGDGCSSGFQRMTVINFKCNETAADSGKGTPVFDHEVDCTYFFDWDTKYACVKEKEDLLCSVTDDKKHYDLSPLSRVAGSDRQSVDNWEAVRSSAGGREDVRFFINICHKVLQKGVAAGCPEEAAVCSVGKTMKNLGKFVSPPKKVGENIQLLYSNGDSCSSNKAIQTLVTLVCRQGDLESAPVLKSMGSDGCLYEFEWHTAAACVLSKTEGDNCRVSDTQAGFSFDLSPLTIKNGSYHVNTSEYDFYLNVCDSVAEKPCEENAGACQVSKNRDQHWNLGVSSARLSYYDGLIQLNYKDGAAYNDEKHTRRSSLITFLCDRNAGIGQPEYQLEDKFAYNFKWYTKYACSERPLECVVMDPVTHEQYDLSSLSKSEGKGGENWYAMDTSTDQRKKYYLNVCRPLNPVPGCDRYSSACQMMYGKDEGVLHETVSISNLGVASKGPVFEEKGRLLLEYTNGSECINAEGEKITYTTKIHLICSEGSLASSPKFIQNQDCVVIFLWKTEAACPVTKEESQTCTVYDVNTGFVFNFQPLATDSGYSVPGNGKTFKLNICGAVKDCGSVDGKPAAGCEFEGGTAMRPVGVEGTLQLSTEGFLTLSYYGPRDLTSGTQDTFEVQFVCNDDSYPGELIFVREEISSETKVYNTFFQFETALACMPAPVDCQVTDSAGNEYDLSNLSKDREPWIAVDTSTNAKNRTFYLNVCKPLPYIHGCPGSAIGSCVIYKDEKSYNLGFIQISPQAATDGSLSIVYLNGAKCTEKQHYSTRIIFHCDRIRGSPVFQEQNGCEFVFVWRTREACPIRRAEGTNCQVQDPRYGYSYNLTALGGQDITVTTDKYEYHFRVCGGISDSSCQPKKAKPSDVVSSCQVQIADRTVTRIAGLYTTNITFENGQIMINYTGGETCHKIYQRSTAVLFYCDPSAKAEDVLYSANLASVNRTLMQPVFREETADCTYLFEWHTPYACPPFKSVQCSLKDSDGNSYDLSPLSQYKENWEAVTRSGSVQKFYINVCNSLVPETGLASCPSGAAACLMDGSKPVSLGEPSSGPQWENDLSVLKYTNGDPCPDNIRRKMTIIRFKCDENRVDSKPELANVIEDCEYTFVWFSAAACPLKSNMEGDCRVTNPVTGHLFDLTSLSRDEGYTIEDRKSTRSVQLNICAEVKSLCEAGTGVCVTEGQKHINAGKFQKQITYTDQVLKLIYEEGDPCPAEGSPEYKSIFSFVCSHDAGAGSRPVLTSFDEKMCVFYFSWHTPLVCEQQVKCSVQNGSSVIDLNPLIQRTGYYEADDDDVDDDDTLDFYINICQPLNPIPDVPCPPRAAVCMIPDNGPPVDIGHVSQPPQINPSIQEVYITFDSTTPCPTDKNLNYSSLIVFHCNKGTDLGKPKMLRKSECSFVFEWNTPVVCPDEVTTSGCSLTDQQLHYTFNLSSLSGAAYKVSGPPTYHVGVCAAASNVPQGKCKDGAVCLVSGSSAFSFGNVKAMKMDYLHQDEALILQYGGGDPCPPVTENGQLCVFPFQYNGKTYNECTNDGRNQPWCATTGNYTGDRNWGVCGKSSGKRESTIIFKCDESAGNGKPKLLSETLGCAATFEWNTDVICPPKMMACKFTQNHKTYDLRPLSSLTASWKLVHDDSLYYLNLCQGVFEGPTGCPKSASICRKTKSGNVQVLGQLHTQKMKLTGDTIIVNYSNGELCGKGKKASTVIELQCAKTFGKPILQSISEDGCEYRIAWATRAACVVKPQPVEMVNGMILNTRNGKNFTLGDIYFKLYNASGDLRTNGDQYVYEIQLSGTSDSAIKACRGANVCQVQTNRNFYRQVGSSSSAKYFIQDNGLDVVFSSNSKCGKDKSKSNVSSTIVFHCNALAGEGIPEFLHETLDCQYLFSWYTSAVCPLVNDSIIREEEKSDKEDKAGLSLRSQAVGAVLGVLLVILTACLLILLLYKKERRETVIQKISSCCRRSSNVSYKYTKVNNEDEADENETEWLMEEISSSNLRPGRESQENGHITSKAVKSPPFSSLHVDDQDSEDEVLTIPDVRIHSKRGKELRGPSRSGNQSKKPVGATGDESASVLLNGGKGMRKSGQRKGPNSLNVGSFHDDSDEDMLNV